MKKLLRIMGGSFSGLMALLLVTALFGGTTAAAGLSPDVPHSLVGMNYKLYYRHNADRSKGRAWWLWSMRVMYWPMKI